MTSPADVRQDPRYASTRTEHFDKQRRDRSSGRRYSEEEIDQEIAAILARRDRKQRGNGLSPPAASKSDVASPGDPVVNGVPFMITAAMKQALRERGYSDQEIFKMKPDEAHQKIRDSQPSAPNSTTPKQGNPPRRASVGIAASKAEHTPRHKVRQHNTSERKPVTPDDSKTDPPPDDPDYTVHKDEPRNADENAKGVALNDFYAYMPMHSYIFAPTGDMWPAASVNARIDSLPLLDQNGKPITEDGKPKRISPSAWLDRHKPIEQMTWAPGKPMLIRDRLISDGGWIARDDVTTFNLYRPPTLKHGNAAAAGLWLNHVRKIYNTDADHIIRWLALRVQRPYEKINHALVLGGSQGVGKDTLLEPIKHAVGPWNFSEVSPQHLLSRFNGFLKSVILRVSEARDLGDVDRFKFYDHSKAFIATPPDVLRVDEKHLREYAVLNVTGVIITTNHKTDGIYLPADDRRHYVAWTDLTRDDFTPGYWNTLWRWYGNGGMGHVAAYLEALDLGSFDPKAPPPKTSAFWDIVQASQTPEDAELADVLDSLSNPAAVTINRIASQASGEFAAWLRERKNRRLVPHRLEKCGYLPVRNEAATDGLWKMHEGRQVIYAKSELSVRDRFAAAQELWGGNR